MTRYWNALTEEGKTAVSVVVMILEVWFLIGVE